MSRQDLGSAVRNARIRSGYPTLSKEWADRVGVSERTLGKLERGERVSDATLVAVEIALNWPEGKAQGLLAGEQSEQASAPHTIYSAEHEERADKLIELMGLDKEGTEDMKDFYRLVRAKVERRAAKHHRHVDNNLN